MSEISSRAAAPVARPSHRWEFSTIALMVAAGCAALLGVLLLVADLAMRSYLLAVGMSASAGWIVNSQEVISGLYQLLGFGYLLGFVLWRGRTRAMVESVGVSDSPALWHWTVAAWYLGLVVSFMIRVANNPADTAALARSVTSSLMPGLSTFELTTPQERLASWLAGDAAQTGARLIGLIFLLIAVWQIRAQVREQVAASGGVQRSGEGKPRRSAVPLPAPARVAPAAATPADEDFWRRVAALATGSRAEVALLETTGGAARRWLLVPESGDLGVARSTIAPGAVVTAFPQPPDASETKGFTPRPADEYHGFLEDADSGAVLYQSVRPNRVGAFLARARRSRRWALYPADSPEALTAVIPPSR